MHRCSFANAEFALKQKRTLHEVLLGEMEGVLPWTRFEARLERGYAFCMQAAAASTGTLFSDS